MIVFLLCFWSHKNFFLFLLLFLGRRRLWFSHSQIYGFEGCWRGRWEYESMLLYKHLMFVSVKNSRLMTSLWLLCYFFCLIWISNPSASQASTTDHKEKLSPISHIPLRTSPKQKLLSLASDRILRNAISLKVYPMNESPLGFSLPTPCALSYQSLGSWPH